MLDLILYWWTF